jgi:hypothetical protein
MFGYFMAFIIGALVVGYLLTQRGRADSRDAKSIDIRQAALSKNPTIIQWEFVQKLAPNIQWGILPQNVVPLLNMQNLVGAQK